MKLFLEELPHQEEALLAILKHFPQVDDKTTDPDSRLTYANPLLYGRYQEDKFLDVKMETGTGKTYVYTRLLYELHKERGLFKFIIVVPSPAIKEGTKHFIQSDYAKQHFSQYYGNVRIDLNVINAGDFKAKSGRKTFPAQLTNFIESSHHNSNIIQVLLVNADMSRSKSMTSDADDQALISSHTRPLDTLAATRPVVIMDEPHRFPRNGKNYEGIQRLNPQAIIRFGATFPDIKVGKGKAAQIKKDYYQDKPVYNLTAVKSFNQGLVKGIQISYPNLSEEEAKNIWKVTKVKDKEVILTKDGKSKTLFVGENLADIDPAFEGDVTYVGAKELSNGLELSVGMSLMPHTFAQSYQELMIEDALDKHFEKEWELFNRPNGQAKIKTLSLFFIDSIASYRQKDGWLRLAFERLLEEKLQAKIKEFEGTTDSIGQEYISYLIASLRDLKTENQTVHAGYFGEDRGSSQEDIQMEVDDILNNKTKILSFKDRDGNWITRRFLFSKWTLREGWDNPNVFVLAKLRTSGSENSKIQEVGRGLRLPVDENGRRVTHEELVSELAFLIGYDEKDFAKTLVEEINSDSPIELNKERLDEQTIKLILDSHKEITEANLKNQLGQDGIIDFSMTYQEGGWEKLCQRYPVLTEQQLKPGKVRDKSTKKPVTHIKLNQDNWNRVKHLWKNFAKRRMVVFEADKVDLSALLDQVFLNQEHYAVEQISGSVQKVTTDKDEAHLIEESTYYKERRQGMAYGQFLRRLANLTSLSIADLHRRVLSVLKMKRDNALLNDQTLKNLVKAFRKAFEGTYAAAYRYESLDFQAATAIYDANKDTFVEEIIVGNLGVNQIPQVSEEPRYLYERPPLFYDSENPEKNLLLHRYEESVTIFGKLPKSAIRVPKYTGGTTSPDFIFVLENEEKKNLYLFVETKSDNQRDSDKVAVAIQERFFKTLDQEAIIYQVATDAEQVYQKLNELSNMK